MHQSRLPASKYRLLGIIGQGQFGRVFCAIQRQTGEMVALKELPTRSLSTKKFLRELRILLTLNHPNIVTCQGIEHSRRGRYLIMNYCDAGTLRDLIDSGTQINIVQKLKLIKDILLGIAHVHQQGIIHRDLKPENILLNLEPGGWLAQLSDFGISLAGEELGIIALGMGDTGSPAYMAPEQFYGKYSNASDLYTIGIILFELLVGKKPFSGTPRELMFAHLNKQINVLDSTPFILKSTINTSLQKLPQNRFKNAEDMIKSIDLSIEILSATQSNKNLFFPKDKAASPVEILSHKVATQPIDKLVFNGKYVYIAVGTHIFYIPYNKTFLPKLKDTQKIKLQDQILDIKVMPFGCMAIVKRQNHYTLYAINNNKIFNKIEQNFTNLIISNGDNQNWFATAENSCLNTWKIPEFTNVKNLVNRKIFRQLMIIDNLHGIAVLDANTNSQSPLFLFNRRGNLVKAFTLQTAFSMVAVNKNYRIFAIEDTEEKLEVIGLLIDLKPLKIKRIALEIKPDFILCQAWGYILANHRGDILILNQKGDCLKKYQLSVGKITAITALPTNRILIASWQNDRASLSYARIRLQ